VPLQDNCPSGSVRVNTDIDANADGILQLSEYVCKGGDPPFTTVKLVASDTALFFGRSVAIHGDYALVGADGDDDGGTMAGAAYVFERTGPNAWDVGTKLTASDAAAIDVFGWSVAIHGDYVLVGAPGPSDGGTRAGAAYVFRRTGPNTWDTGTKLAAPDAEAAGRFGKSVAINGNYALVNGNYTLGDGGFGPGVAYVFRRTGPNTWDTGTKLAAPDAQAGDGFGDSVAINGDYALVGAGFDDDGGTNAGAAYVFRRTGPNAWDVGTKLTAPDAAAWVTFGLSVAIDGDYALVGAFAGGSPKEGAAYIFR
jgi:hypothetical protein